MGGLVGAQCLAVDKEVVREVLGNRGGPTTKEMAEVGQPNPLAAGIQEVAGDNVRLCDEVSGLRGRLRTRG